MIGEPTQGILQTWRETERRMVRVIAGEPTVLHPAVAADAIRKIDRRQKRRRKGDPK